MHTHYLAGISTTSGNAAMDSLVGKTIAAVSVVGIAIFAYVVINAAYGKVKGDGRFAPGGGRHGAESGMKNIVVAAGVGVTFFVLVFGAWGIYRLAGGLSGGLFN